VRLQGRMWPALLDFWHRPPPECSGSELGLHTRCAKTGGRGSCRAAHWNGIRLAGRLAPPTPDLCKVISETLQELVKVGCRYNPRWPHPGLKSTQVPGYPNEAAQSRLPHPPARQGFVWVAGGLSLRAGVDTIKQFLHKRAGAILNQA
jgi:hypothetical protein